MLNSLVCVSACFISSEPLCSWQHINVCVCVCVCVCALVRIALMRKDDDTFTHTHSKWLTKGSRVCVLALLCIVRVYVCVRFMLGAEPQDWLAIFSKGCHGNRCWGERSHLNFRSCSLCLPSLFTPCHHLSHLKTELLKKKKKKKKLSTEDQQSLQRQPFGECGQLTSL